MSVVTDRAMSFYGSVFAPNQGSSPSNSRTNLAPSQADLNTAASKTDQAMQNWERGVNRIKNLGGDVSNVAGSMLGQYNQVTPGAIRNVVNLANVSEQQMADKASIETGKAFDQQQGLLRRNLARTGINANTGRFAGMEQDFNLARAAAMAGARNEARIKARDINFTRNMQLAGFGAGLGNAAAGMFSRASEIASNAATGLNNIYRERSKYTTDLGQAQANILGLR